MPERNQWLPKTTTCSLTFAFQFLTYLICLQRSKLDLMNRINLFLVAVFVCHWCIMAAQGDFYKKFTMYDGLAQQQVTCIFQDSRGYMWIGTKGGLSKFNGVTFENFGTSEGLIYPYVTDLEEDKDGNLWIATWFGLNRYDGQKIIGYKTQAGIRNLIEIDDRQIIWVSHNVAGENVSDAQLSIFKNNQLVPAHEIYPALNGLEVDQMLFDNANNRMVFVSEKNGLFIFTNDQLTVLADGKNTPFQIRQKDVFFHGEIIINKKIKDGVYSYCTLSENGLKELNVNIDYDNLLTHDREGNLYCITNQYKEFFKIENLEPVPNYHELNVFSTIYFDQQNNLWLGTEEGVVQVFSRAFAKPNVRLNENIWSIVEDNKNNMWFASLSDGLQKYDGENLQKFHGYEMKEFSHPRFYMGATKLENGNIIFPLEKYVMEYDGQKFSPVLNASGDLIGSCQSVVEDTARGFLALTSVDGVYIGEKDGGLTFYGNKEGLHITTHASCVDVDQNGFYWIGTENGLARFDYDRKEFKNYTKEIGNLEAIEIKTIKKDCRNNMWFGGREGIYFYEEKKDSIVRVAADVINRTVNFLLEYEKELLVVGAIDGLYLLHLKDYYEAQKIKLEVFNHHNGYFGIDPIANGACLDSKGIIWIPTREDVIIFDPKKRLLNTLPLNTTITSINGDKIPFNQHGYVYEVADGINELKIKFEAIGHSRPFKTQYAYLLENVDNEWSEWQEEPFVIFNDLKTGRYLFRVKAKNMSNQEDQPIMASVTCVVSLPFWKEPHFYMYALVIITVLFGVGIYLFFRQRIEYARALKNEQEIKYLRVQTLQAQMNPHFVFNVLGTLQNLILNSDTKKANEHLVNLSKLIRRFLDSSVKSDLPKNISAENEITLEKEIELIQMYIEFEQLQYENEFDFTFEIGEGLNISSHTIPPMIIQPYVENAIKHGILPKEGKGLLSIQLYEENENLTCIIEDDGVGRARAKEIQQKSLRSYKSHGTELVKRRIDILNEMGYQIHINTTDRPGGGTKVEIKIGY